MENGIFISTEGILGCGKSTQAELLTQSLSAEGWDVFLTREPGGTKVGEKIRELLLFVENLGLTPKAEMFLFAAARAQLVEKEIAPALARKQLVVCDRYADSSITYQGFGRGLSLDLIELINQMATDGCLPDLTLLYDLEVAEGIRRKAECKAIDRLDEYDPDFHQKVKKGYLQLAANKPEQWRVIDASGPIKAVQKATWVTVSDFLHGRNKEGASRVNKEIF